MIIQQQITDKLTNQLSPLFLDVVNESHQHNVPEGSESHFKVTLISEAFEGKRLIQRHRMVNQVLADELANHIHALALHTFTREEWQNKMGEVPASPKCLGGSKLG
ncbi:transcriptional regulator BolA [Alteromonas facilis]|uniref:transcriptional regulator BolA n=1 Tax=Alteromonas facilis TaxID=2048004 RepID=UPI000C285CCF|nr:transcriptional regulator BolA [Alteromonas facilis]